MAPVRILLADDHVLMRNGLRHLLERQPGFLVVAEASTGRKAVELTQRHEPDVVIMDIAMPQLNGIEAAARITSGDNRTGVVILSMHSDEAYVLRALKSGARGYLLKDSAEADLCLAIQAVGEGKAFFSPASSKVLAEDYVREMTRRGVEDSYELLTPGERELL